MAAAWASKTDHVRELICSGASRSSGQWWTAQSLDVPSSSVLEYGCPAGPTSCTAGSSGAGSSSDTKAYHWFVEVCMTSSPSELVQLAVSFLAGKAVSSVNWLVSSCTRSP